MTVNDYTGMIAEANEQLRLVKQIRNFIFEASFAGSEAKDVAQSLSYLESLVRALESNIESLKREREEAKNNLPPLDPPAPEQKVG